MTTAVMTLPVYLLQVGPVLGMLLALIVRQMPIGRSGAWWFVLSLTGLVAIDVGAAWLAGVHEGWDGGVILVQASRINSVVMGGWLFAVAGLWATKRLRWVEAAAEERALKASKAQEEANRRTEENIRRAELVVALLQEERKSLEAAERIAAAKRGEIVELP